MTDDALGESPERLTLEQRERLEGQWIALEIYTPKTLPLRRIRAVGPDPMACLERLRASGLDPELFELQRL